MTVRIIGSDKLKRKLDMLDRAVRDRMAERALVAGALPVVNDAKRLAPYQTGTLRRSIHIGGHEDLTPDYRPPDGGQRTSSPVPTPHTTDGVTHVYVGTNLEYAAAQEFGTSKGVPEHPYLRPAADSNRQVVIQETAEALRDQLRELLR